MTIRGRIKDALYYIVPAGKGAIVTLASYLQRQDLTHGRIGASTKGYGAPLPWFEEVIYADQLSTVKHRFNLGNFVLDAIFWSFLIGTEVVVPIYLWHKSKKKIDIPG